LRIFLDNWGEDDDFEKEEEEEKVKNSSNEWFSNGILYINSTYPQ